MTRVHGVEVYSWNPRRNPIPLLRRYQVGPRVNNFGDLLGPLVAAHFVDAAKRNLPATERTLLSVGSVMHVARNDDVVWGTGVNGKVGEEEHNFTSLDVRAVRGPRTRQWLREHRGIDSPETYGDPGLLIPTVFPELRALTGVKRRKIAVVPNLNDRLRFSRHPGYLNPRSDVKSVLATIAHSETVVGSSLHGVIVAESLGIPAAFIRTAAEPDFKYLDYAQGTGRNEVPTFDRFEDAVKYVSRSGGHIEHPLAAWSATPLIEAFPIDLWTVQAR